MTETTAESLQRKGEAWIAANGIHGVALLLAQRERLKDEVVVALSDMEALTEQLRLANVDQLQAEAELATLKEQHKKAVGLLRDVSCHNLEKRPCDIANRITAFLGEVSDGT